MGGCPVVRGMGSVHSTAAHLGWDSPRLHERGPSPPSLGLSPPPARCGEGQHLPCSVVLQLKELAPATRSDLGKGGCRPRSPSVVLLLLPDSGQTDR